MWGEAWLPSRALQLGLQGFTPCAEDGAPMACSGSRYFAKQPSCRMLDAGEAEARLMQCKASCGVAVGSLMSLDTDKPALGFSLHPKP